MTAVALLAALVALLLWLRTYRSLQAALLRDVLRSLAARRVAQYSREIRDDLDIADVVGAELAAGLHYQSENYDAAIDALTARVAELMPRETSASIAAWQDATFGPATTDPKRLMETRALVVGVFDALRDIDLSMRRPNLSRAIRAAEELTELIRLLAEDDNAAKAPEEVADIDIVLRGIDAVHGVERADQVAAKMARNRARRWKITGDGHGQHVDESTADSACDDRNAFVDSELDPERDDAFRAHLGGCPSCREQLIGDIQLAARLSTLPPDGAQ